MKSLSICSRLRRLILMIIFCFSSSLPIFAMTLGNPENPENPSLRDIAGLTKRWIARNVLSPARSLITGRSDQQQPRIQTNARANNNRLPDVLLPDGNRYNIFSDQENNCLRLRQTGQRPQQRHIQLKATQEAPLRKAEEVREVREAEEVEEVTQAAAELDTPQQQQTQLQPAQSIQSTQPAQPAQSIQQTQSSQPGQTILPEQHEHTLITNALLQALEAGNFQQFTQHIQEHPELVAATSPHNQTIFHALASYYHTNNPQAQLNQLINLLAAPNNQFTYIAHQLTTENEHFIHTLMKTDNLLSHYLTKDQWHIILDDFYRNFHTVNNMQRALDIYNNYFLTINGKGLPLIHYAARNNISALIEELLTGRNALTPLNLYEQQGLDINTRDDAGKTVLFYGIKNHQAPLLRKLFAHNPAQDYNAIRYETVFDVTLNEQITLSNQTALMVAVYVNLPSELMETLIQKSKSFINRCDNHGQTALHKAIATHNIHHVATLLNAKSAQNSAPAIQPTPYIKLATQEVYNDILYFAFYHKAQTEIINLLLDHGALATAPALRTQSYQAPGYNAAPDTIQTNEYQHPEHAFCFFIDHAILNNNEAFKTALCLIKKAKDGIFTGVTVELIVRLMNKINTLAESSNFNNEHRTDIYHCIDIFNQLGLFKEQREEADLLEATQRLQTQTAHNRVAQQRQEQSELEKVRRQLNQATQENKTLSRTLKISAVGAACYLNPSIIPTTWSIITTVGSAAVSLGATLLGALM